MSTEQPSTTSSRPNILSLWHRLKTRTKTALIALVAVLAGWSTVKQQAFDPLWEMYTHRQPHYDAKLVSGLRTGILLTQFKEDMGEDSVTVLDESIPFLFVGDRRVSARNELFILKTFYVEAFVDDATERVIGYTVTARNSDLPESIDVGGRTFEIGTVTFADAPLSHVVRVAPVCGAHTAAYYEISGTSGAERDQTFAVGFTMAGATPSGFTGTVCPEPPHDLRPAANSHSVSAGGLYVAPEYEATSKYMKLNRAYRSRTPINAVAITAPAYEMASEMISLHPGFLSPLESAEG